MSRSFAAVWQNIVIVLLACILCLPCLIHGLPLVGDSTLHATYQHQFSSQFWSGEIYPRWIAGANQGYGSPIFLIQYPLPYWTTALLRPITRFAVAPNLEARELGIFCFLVLAGAGLSSRYWLRKTCTPLAATAAAMVYISLPFLLAFEIYYDLAIGQFMAFVWMPLALAACESLRLKFTAVSALGIVWALLVLSNFMTALMFLPLLLGYAMTCRHSDESPFAKSVIALFLSLTVGTCLAAVYIFPFVANLRLFNINALLSLPGYELSHYLSYVRLESLQRPLLVPALGYALILVVIAVRSTWRGARWILMRAAILLTLGLGVLMIVPGLGMRLISTSGLKLPIFKEGDYFPERLLIMSLLTFALAAFAYSNISQQVATARGVTLGLLMAWAVGCTVLMLPWSASLWHALPLIATGIQFPFRLEVLLAIAVTGLLGAAFDGSLLLQENGETKPTRLYVMLMVLAVIAGGVFTFRADQTWQDLLRNPTVVHAEETHDVDHTYRTYVPESHLAEFANLIGAGLNNYRSQASIAPGTASLVEGQGTVNVVREGPRKLLLSYDLVGEGRARVGLVYSPLWTVRSATESSGTPMLASSPEGLVELALGPGRHRLQLVFDGGWPERYGVIVTLVSIMVVLGGILIVKVRMISPLMWQLKAVDIPGDEYENQVHK